MLRFIFILITIIAFFGCTNDDPCVNSEKGVIKDLTGLDGCTWVIELADGSRLEPVNIGNYAAQIKDGKKVWVSYHEVQGGSICMVGKIVVIDCLSDR